MTVKLEVKLTNGLEEEGIVLKEGYGGTYRTLITLKKKGDSYIINLDPNDTYREYIIRITEGDEKPSFIISSDDVYAFEAVKVVRDDVTGKVDMQKTPRRMTKTTPPEQASGSRFKFPSFLGKLWAWHG